MYKTLIIDDELPARIRMRELCIEHKAQIQLVGEATRGLEAIKLIDQIRPDLILLDIQMPDISGLEVLQHIHHQPLVIFTTAYTKYAVQAFETLSIDYLIKPIEKTRFAQSLQKLNIIVKAGNPSIDLDKLQLLLDQSQKQKPTYSIAIKKGDRIIFVDYENIIYLKSEDKYVTIVEKNGDTHLSQKAMHQLESLLPDNFIRINRSCTLNRTYIQSIEKYFKGTLIIHLQSGESLKTGETYSKAVKTKLGI